MLESRAFFFFARIPGEYPLTFLVYLKDVLIRLGDFFPISLFWLFSTIRLSNGFSIINCSFRSIFSFLRCSLSFLLRASITIFLDSSPSLEGDAMLRLDYSLGVSDLMLMNFASSDGRILPYGPNGLMKGEGFRCNGYPAP
jgi:hypothetical protein